MRTQIAGLLVGASILAGCGTGVLPGGASDGLSEADKSRMAEKFENCMAEGGLEAEVGFEGGGLDINVGSSDPNMTDEQMMAIEAECETHLEAIEAEGPQLTPEEEAQLSDANFEVQKCLAEDGYVVTATEDGIDMDGEGQPADFDQAEFEAAETACFKQAIPELWEKYGPEGE